MFSSQFGFPSALLRFSVILFHLCCFHFTDGTQNACQDLLTGASRIRAMLHNEQTDQFYLLTSSGHIFIEPISNFDHASSPPSLKLTQAKYIMPTNWNIQNNPETITADSADLAFWVNQDKPTETLLNNVWQNQEQICAYPGVKLDEGKAQVEPVLGICASIFAKTSHDFWLGFNSQSYGMVKANGLYCRIYFFPYVKNVNLLGSSDPWKLDSVCLGIVLGDKKPLCGVVHKKGDVAVLIVDTSTVYVYRKLKFQPQTQSSDFLDKIGTIFGKSSDSANTLIKKQRSASRPTWHQMNEFIKCQELKAETNPPDVASKVEEPKVEQPGVNQPKPDNPSEPKTHKPKLDTPMMRKRLLFISGILLLVALLFGLVVKFKLTQAFPWNRKRKGVSPNTLLISQAISLASVVSRDSALQRILQQRKENKKPATPGAVTRMLEKVKKNLVNFVEAAKKHNKKKTKKKKIKKKIKKKKKCR